ncbi:DUF762 family protein [Candidiatus Paracoxiella cheracis]|uniref:DUF762 family protein n=1 Tax=Candidiatus Paracoxiella cheracis TaxID=3405120 RepID=UPI003BF52B48
MSAFFTVPKPQYGGESELLEREKKDDTSGKITLKDWVRNASNACEARVFVMSGTSPNTLTTAINESDLNAYMRDDDGERIPLLSDADQYIKQLLEKHGLENHRIYKYIRMFANINGFLPAGQIVMSQVKNSGEQSPIHTENPKYTFFVKDKTTVQYTEESDIVLNPTHEYGKGETIAKLKVVSIISSNDQKIHHILDSASLTAYPGKEPQCIKCFGDNRSVMVKLIHKLKEMFMAFVALFTKRSSCEQDYNGFNDVASNAASCRR